jgi:hypothetical protein
LPLTECTVTTVFAGNAVTVGALNAGALRTHTAPVVTPVEAGCAVAVAVAVALGVTVAAAVVVVAVARAIAVGGAVALSVGVTVAVAGASAMVVALLSGVALSRGNASGNNAQVNCR